LAVFGYIGEETTEIRRNIEAAADITLLLSNTEFISITKHPSTYLISALAYLIVRVFLDVFLTRPLLRISHLQTRISVIIKQCKNTILFFTGLLGHLDFRKS
jgi:hypothetical protein